MSCFKAHHLLLLAWVVVCAGTTSCRLVDSRGPGEKNQIDGSGTQMEKGGKKVLSEREIIAAANRAARRHGFNLARYHVAYDKDNAGWRYGVTRMSPGIIKDGRYIWPEGAFEANLHRHWPELESHDYQAVIYYGRSSRNEPVGGIEGRTWILVDRNTGEVLLVVDEPG
jgi:hypothetical protein